MRLLDRALVDGMDVTREGYLRVSARINRSGVQQYYGYEIGQEPPGKTFNVHRPEDEVFSEEALASFRLAAVTDGHPFDGVTAENWKKEARGIVAEDVRREGEHTVATLLITDAEIVNRIQRTGSVELSCGYDCELDLTPGFTASAQTYDAVQRKIRGNHVAVVDQGRCGPACSTQSDGGDAMPSLTDCPGESRCSCQRKNSEDQDMTKKTVTIDGKTLEVTVEVAAVIDGLVAKLYAAASEGKAIKDAAAELRKVVEDHTAVKADEIAALKAKVAELEGKVPTADALDAMAEERASVIADARKIDINVETKGKSLSDIRKAAVAKVLGDKASTLDGKSDDYISAKFESLVDASKSPDPVAHAMRNSDGKAAEPKGRAAYLDSLSNAWKGA